MQVADIVNVTGFGSMVWVIFAPAFGPNSERRWLVRSELKSQRGSVIHERVAGEGDLTLILRPIFEIGDVFNYEGEPGEVVAVLSDKIELAPRDKIVPVAGGYTLRWPATTPVVGKADLILENIAAFVA